DQGGDGGRKMVIQQIDLVVLFTDIEGSSARWEHYTSAMGEAVARHDHLLTSVILNHGGIVFKSRGDGLCAVFPSAEQALHAALHAQHGLSRADFMSVGGLRVRIAVHLGPAEARDGDFFGPAVNRVARLLDIGHGGQILVSGPAAAAVAKARLPAGAALRSLGAHRLRDLRHPEQVFQLAVEGLPDEFPPLRSLTSVTTNLPIQTSDFFGRDAELSALRDVLKTHRLITLLGPGGIGKTRLALQAAAEPMDGAPDGVWLVELAGLTDEAQVPQAVAAIFNINLNVGGSPVEQIANALHTSRLLLVLDNCEHLVAAVAALADTVLSRGQNVMILATSRMPLGIAGEQIFAVPALSLPEPTTKLTANQVMQHASIQLFVARARAASPEFNLDDTTAPDIAAICQRLDGIALAIELAAARTRMLRPAELLARLNDRFRILTGGSRAVLPRHQTMRALIDWSFDLLSPPERLVLSRLAVFAGSFTIAGAEAVVAGGQIHEREIFDMIGQLLDKSFLVRLPQFGAESRFRLLETTRHYALEKLDQNGETEKFRRSLAVYMIRLFSTARDRWPEADAELWRAEFDPEIDNLRAAIGWAFGKPGDPALGIALVSRRFWAGRGGLISYSEEMSGVESAISCITAETPLADEAWIRLGTSYMPSLGYAQDSASAMRALALFRTLGDQQLICFSAMRVALRMTKPDSLEAAQTFIEEVTTSLPHLPHNRIRSVVLGYLGTVAVVGGGSLFGLARRYFDQSLAIAERFNDHTQRAIIRHNLAELEGVLGNYEAAIAQALIVAGDRRARYDALGLGSTLTNLVAYAALNHDITTAQQAATEASILLRDSDNRVDGAVFAGNVALLASCLGLMPVSATLAGFCDAFFVGHAMAREPLEQRVWSRLTEALDLAIATGIISQEACNAAKAAGATLSLEKALLVAGTVSNWQPVDL
ncbi:MAG: adenylate/guanylate cyclase domain-containing protein, partial [Acidocella sp.]|nr:adenylate/guanylate cyclase domain-containing protein [Acidocella sp.]